MNKETLQALEGSIEKWQHIVGTTEAEDKGVENCPLCAMFWHGGCKGCPVSEATGRDNCRDSPYTAWAIHIRTRVSQVRGIPGHPQIQNHRELGCEVCLELARAELTFLVGLLPDKDKKQGKLKP